MRSHRIVASLSIGFVAVAATAVVVGQTISVSVSASGTVIRKPVPTPDPVGPSIPCGRPVDLVICLDTSGSMAALLDSARAKLWEVVNELSGLEPTPILRVGLLTYGSPNRASPAQGYVYRHTDLIGDLDTVYAHMMEMSTNGGDEYVGWVLNDALRTMSWSQSPDALKIVFVAGNESADQAANMFNFRHIASEARAAGITINAIYAGSRQQGIAEHWDQVAMHGGGEYLAIDMQAGLVQIATPQDRILIELNAKLNATYIPFGKDGRQGKANQDEQDANSAKFGRQSIGTRVAVKATALYDNARWDLVDAAAKPGFDLSKVEKKDLPVVMQSMARKEIKQHVARASASRKNIQREIQEANDARMDYMRQERLKKGGKQTFDDALRKTIRKQAKAKNFKKN